MTHQSFQSFIESCNISVLSFFKHCNEEGQARFLEFVKQDNAINLRIIFLFNFEDNPLFSKGDWFEIHTRWTIKVSSLNSDVTVPIFNSLRQREIFLDNIEALYNSPMPETIKDIFNRRTKFDEELL